MALEYRNAWTAVLCPGDRQFIKHRRFTRSIPLVIASHAEILWLVIWQANNIVRYRFSSTFGVSAEAANNAAAFVFDSPSTIRTGTNEVIQCT